MKKLCRLFLNDSRPLCLTKPCTYRCLGKCSGPVVAQHNYYSMYNCPDDADTCTPRCGQFPECRYCRDYHTYTMK